jgi:hypothetical protein
MRGARLTVLSTVLLAALLSPFALAAGDGDDDAAHRFTVLGYASGKGNDKGGARAEDETRLKESLAAADDKATSFLVVTGIKDEREPCSDKLYQKRRELFDEAQRPVIVVPAGSDWTGCLNSAGRTNAIERLNRLREVLYGDPGALGKGQLALTRQSSSARFRGYAENAHWSVGSVMYATLNLPANNNHYLLEAGRNNEYEDRLVANRFWLNRLFAIARREKRTAVVLFADGDLKALSQPTGLRALLRQAVAENDGFAEMRRQVLLLAQKFPGKVLLVDNAPPAKPGVPAVEWRGNLGHLSTGGRTLEVEVDDGAKPTFTVRGGVRGNPGNGLHPKAVRASREKNAR